ncbi:hypothetical protein [Amycolatopsis palatopharyngis]|uniref:hypothetical protein n=1 Tax=Amycolatopsis palatopharyngis TaxID=187982 RepID=UPI001FE816B9|nr:hypothetical protein [Amycolatopsis palatopharyngis]
MLQFDWGTGPFWVSVGDDIPYDVDVDDLWEVVVLSDELLAAVAEWDDRMQSTYNDETPQDIGIRDPVEEAKWVADGRDLARRMKGEVGPRVRVEYSALGDTPEVIEA